MGIINCQRSTLRLQENQGVSSPPSLFRGLLELECASHPDSSQLRAPDTGAEHSGLQALAHPLGWYFEDIQIGTQIKE